MTRALDLTQRQVRALCEGAKKAGYAPIVQIGNTLVRLVPGGSAKILSFQADSYTAPAETGLLI